MGEVMSRILALVWAVLLCSLPACTQSEQDKLVWLSPAVPCEIGDANFGAEHCFVRRKRDAIAVLRVPANYGQPSDGSEVGRFSAEDVIFTRTEVLTSGKSRDKWLAELKAIRDRKDAASSNDSYVMQSLGWGWRIKNAPFGHESAKLQMASDSKSPNFGAESNFVLADSSAPDFLVYERQACIKHVGRISSTKGQLTPPSPCAASFEYYLAKNDARVFAKCLKPYVYDEKIIQRTFCSMESHFELRKAGGSPFIVTFGYSASWEDLVSGRWKHVNQRFERWIRSMDVSDYELERIKK
jgi:hypothetical protein